MLSMNCMLNGVKVRTLRWVEDFLRGRSVYMKTEDGDSDRYDLPSGVPQGSVLSPLLFNVVMADLPQHLHKNIHIGMYADAICLWTSGVQLPALQRRLQDALDCTLAFLTQRGMDISPEKTVFLPFTRKKMNNFQLQLSTQPVQRVSHHRFLGVIIDAADTRINILRHLTGPRWGMSTSSLLTVHRALIQQMAAYHLPVLNNICATSENILQGVLARSLKVCLGVPSATSNTLTVAEAKEPPFEALRVCETVLHYLRLCTQHDHHPLVRKLLRRNSSFLKALSPYRRTLPTARPQQADPHPPSTLQTPSICTTVPGINQGKSSLPPLAMRQHCLELMERHKGRVAIFTDGSTTLSGSASAFVIPEHKREGIARLSHRTSSTTAELVVVQLAMTYLATLELPAQWLMYCDSKAGLEATSSFLGKGRTASTVRDLLLWYRKCTDIGHDVVLQWIPGHIGISGNEKADKMANIAHLSSTEHLVAFSKQDIKSLLKSMTDDIRRT
ncbi:uncharacterized protein LOC135395714 [Ornithodoros turicata]|uniref:uncharacterized protein LOC135395714 n=1 Tax=Ornithodoros turicata TaxID=34597 RepID=UPI00313A0C72